MNKRTLGQLGILLIAGGALVLILQGISYTSRETVLDMGPITVQADTRRTLPVSPVLGGLALAGGIVLLMASRKE